MTGPYIVEKIKVNYKRFLSVLSVGSLNLFDVEVDLYFGQTLMTGDVVGAGIKFNVQANGAYDYAMVYTRSVEV